MEVFLQELRNKNTRMPKAKKNTTLESQLKRLEEIVESLEQGELTLDDAIKMYEEGIQISKSCMEKLSKTELTLKRLSKTIQGNFELFDEDLNES